MWNEILNNKANNKKTMTRYYATKNYLQNIMKPNSIRKRIFFCKKLKQKTVSTILGKKILKNT